LLALVRRQDRRHGTAFAWPARSTVAELLRRNGLTTPRRRRAVRDHPGRPLTPMTAPNVIWTADYKGQFRLGDGHYCFPLTRAGRVQSLSPGLPRAHRHDDDGVSPGIHALVPGVRSPGDPAHRQWGTLRDRRARAPLATERVVDPARDLSRAHRTGASRAERAPRAHAPHAETGDRSSAGALTAPTAAALRSFGRSTTRCVRTKHSATPHPRRAMGAHHGHFRAHSRRSSIRRISRCASSPRTAAFAGRMLG
jgi:hypothetical protein